jgi:uncharacterized membrane protein YeaQ/YmgE (transglycosylase-associated protein family)
MIMLEALIFWLAVGAIVGWLASQIMVTGGFGMQGDIIVGAVSGLVGGMLLAQLGLLGGTVLGHIINAAIGAVIGTFVARLVKQSQSQAK